MAGVPTYGELSQPQAAAVAALLLADLVDVDTSTAPANGYIYRHTGTEGFVKKALGDSLTNVAAIAGVADASGVIHPLGSGLRTIRFTAAPTAGLPVYLSAATDGKATTTQPSLKCLPIGVVVSDESVGSDYWGIVECPYHSILDIDSLTAEQQFLVDTASDLGGTPADYWMQGEDFNAVYLNDTPVWTRYDVTSTKGTVGTFTGAATSLVVSRNGPWVSTYTTKAWAMRMKVKVTFGGSPALKAIYIISTITTGIGRFSNGEGFGKWVAFDEIFNPQTGAEPAAGHVVADATSGYDIVEVQGDGSGHYRARVNGAAWSAWWDMQADVTTTSKLSVISRATGDLMEVDYFYFAQRRP